MNTEANLAIQNVLQTYFNGYLGAESELVARAFHPETRLFSIDADALDKTEMPAWITNLNSRKERQDVRKAHTEVLSIDVTRDAAIAKVALTFEKSKFTDYLSLLRIEGEWRIIGKIYTNEAL